MVFGVRSILSWLNTSPSDRPAAATCASSTWECCQDPNLAEREARRSTPALGISELSSKGRQVTDAVTSGASAAIALSSRRLATQHQGQIASEITSMESVALTPNAGPT